ncbi:cold-shock protein [Nocardia sp. NPDC004278]
MAKAYSTGTVKFYKAEKGWGAISSPDLPAGCDAWVSFSCIDGEGFRTLTEGDRVEFRYEQAQQDSFQYRATWVRKV